MNLNAERSLDVSQLEQDEKIFLHEHSIDIGAQSGTPSSVLLAPIQERVTSRRVRKKRFRTQRQPSGFPQPLSAEKAPSIFARNYAREQPPVEPAVQNQAASDADIQFRAMTEAEKQEAVQEIYSRLTPEMIEFMKTRSKTRSRGSRSIRNAQLGATEGVEQVMKVDMDIRPDPLEVYPDSMDICGGGANTLSADFQKLDLESNPTVDALEDTAYLVKEGLPKEKEKLEWMGDACDFIDGQEQVEAGMRKCVEELGDIGRRRFDLNGSMLTAEQIANLPTHLGLHHHGSNPAEAGYTLSEILLLTRSTVSTQRAMAYSILSRIIGAHRDVVVEALVRSGALPLAFSNLKEINSSAPNPAAAVAQLSAAEAVLKPFQAIGMRELSYDVYFASLFYSPCAVGSTPPVVRSLQSSDFVPSLITFAHMWFLNKQFDFCCRALCAARMVVNSCNVVSGKELVLKTSLPHMFEMANGNGNISTCVTFLACDIIAFYMLFAGWGEMQESEAASYLFRDKNLKRIGGCLQFYLTLPKNISDETHLASAASLRVFRAALTFDNGVELFRERLPAICALSLAYQHRLKDDNAPPSLTASTEAFLALESYVHALYSTTNSEKARTASSSDSVQAKESETDDGNRQKKEALYAQLLALVPLTRSATHMFGQSGYTRHQVAAGHFAGSVFSLCREPMSPDLASNVLQVAKVASETLSRLSSVEAISSMPTRQFDVMVSATHAAGRMLTRCMLPESLVRQICRNLISVSEFESKQRFRHGQRFIRPGANAAAEWLVKYSQLRPNQEAVYRAVQLLPHVAEPQVIIELIFRCIVSPPLLEVLNSRITRSMWKDAADKLVSPTLTKLLSEQRSASSEKHLEEKVTLAAFADIVQWWLCSVDTVEEGALVATTLLSSDLISPVGIYRALSYASPVTFVNGSMLSKLALLCGEKTFRDNKFAFHPHCNTCVSIYSAQKRPPLAENFYRLTARLVERGPLSAEEGESNLDGIASLILTTMCRRDAHISLRLHLWRETVCLGGGKLFEYAQFLGGVPSIDGEDDEDEIVASYCRALVDGLVSRQRSPQVLQQVICARVCARLQSGKNLHTVEVLVKGDSPRHQEAKEALVEWTKLWRSDSQARLLTEFLSTCSR